MARRNWTREETIVAFNVYCKIPFKKSSKTHPTIIKYAKIIGRTPSALNMKIGNFGRLDPELKKKGITGLINGSKLEEEIWDEFQGNWSGLAYESEHLIAKFQNIDFPKKSTQFPEGRDKLRATKTRINQSFFRSTILSSYNLQCCITGISIPELLIASHIKPWSVDIENRTNPHNGLCLNSLHDKAFDKGFITVNPNFTIQVSQKLYDNQSEISRKYFTDYHNKKIIKPERFLPNKEFLDYHINNIFQT